MLSELHITNFAIIDDLRLAFDPGFNVLTGETGAGKSIIVDAVDMLLGGKAGQEVIRAGAALTQVEALFVLSPAAATAINPLLEQEGLEGDDPNSLLLSRELRRGGRSVVRVNGRAVAVSVLKEIGNRLVDIHGQSDHLSLMRPREHVNLLDRYGGLMAQRERLAATIRQLTAVRKELANLRRDRRELARRIDLLTFQVDDIEAANLEPGEDAALEAERRRLANAEQLIRLADSARMHLADGDREQPAALDQVSSAAGSLSRLATIDQEANPLLEMAEALSDQLQELAQSLEAYAETVEANPERLVEVEERLALLFNLKRKYGDTIEDIRAFGRQARAELDSLANAEVRTTELEDEERRLLRHIGQQGADLSRARRLAATTMAIAVEHELTDLRMDQARFAVDLHWHPAPEGAPVDEASLPDSSLQPGCYGFDTTGLDQVEFLVSANPGEPLKPLIKVASGGETSRLMLALKTVLGHADETPTLIFDEIDVGIGGRVGSTVGQKLWGLTRHNGGDAPEITPTHQVLCITHLPQLAGYGDRHFHVLKQIEGQHTSTAVVRLDGPERIAELAAMLGSTSQAARESVEEMLAEVTAAKSQS